MSERAIVGDMPLDEPVPVDVGDLVGAIRLPVDAEALARWLTVLAADWAGYTLSVALGDIGLRVVIAEAASDD